MARSRPKRLVRPRSVPARLEWLEDRACPSSAFDLFDAPLNFSGVGDLRFRPAVADVTGDGIPDFVNFGHGRFGLSDPPVLDDLLYVVPGIGDGTFRSRSIQTRVSGSDVRQFALGDFNADGKADLVYGQSTIGSAFNLGVMLGNGDGTFRDAVPQLGTAKVQEVVGLAVGDFDGDADADIAALHYIFNAFEEPRAALTVLSNRGDGTFSSTTVPLDVFVTAPGPVGVSLVSGDFNGDGRPDLAFSDPSRDPDNAYGGLMHVLINEGNGTFRAPVAYEIPPSGIAGELAVGDFDGDGVADLALAGRRGGPEEAVYLFLGRGDGIFADALAVPAIIDGNLAAADFDGDGRTDLVIPGSSEFAFHRATAAGGFAAPVRIPSPGATSFYVIPVDLDGDGRLDLVAQRYGSSNAFSVFMNRPGRLFLGITEIGYGAAGEVIDMRTADINADGIEDVLLQIRGNPFLGVTPSVITLLGRPGGGFRDPVVAPIPESFFKYVLGDLNGDGRPDLIGVYAIQGRSWGGPSVIVTMRGNGDGTFDAVSTLRLDTTPAGLALGDFDGDGRLDLVAPMTRRSSITIFPGRGDGTFLPGVEFSTIDPISESRGFDPTDIAVADLDGDGTLDLAVTFRGDAIDPFSFFLEQRYRENNGGVSILNGRGDGTFLPARNYLANLTTKFATRPVTLVVTDLDGDGRPDVLTGGFERLLNRGDGTFQADLSAWAPGLDVELLAGGGGPMLLRDVDRDGLLDVVQLRDLALAEARIAFGNGDGSFRSPVYVSLAHSDVFTMFDFDGDGWADILAYSPEQPIGPDPADRLRIIRNTAPVAPPRTPPVAPPRTPPVAPPPGGGGGSRQSTMGDYDGDGKADLALYYYDAERQSGVFEIQLSTGGVRQVLLGRRGAIPVPGDFDGDGIADPAVVDPEFDVDGDGVGDLSRWTIVRSSDGRTITIDFGGAGRLDRPAPADFDGDGITDIATFRANSDITPGAAEWFILPSSTNAAYRVAFGAAGGTDLPAPADFDGDGRADIATFRPEPTAEDVARGIGGVAQWFILPSGSNDATFSGAVGGVSVVFGAAGNADKPMLGDYNGDGRVDIVTFRSNSDVSPGNASWFILPTRDAWPGFGAGYSVLFGAAREYPIPAAADYDGDGRLEFAVFQPPEYVTVSQGRDGLWVFAPVAADGRPGPRRTETFGSSFGMVPVASPLYYRLVLTGNFFVPSVASAEQRTPRIADAGDLRWWRTGPAWEEADERP